MLWHFHDLNTFHRLLVAALASRMETMGTAHRSALPPRRGRALRPLSQTSVPSRVPLMLSMAPSLPLETVSPSTLLPSPSRELDTSLRMAITTQKPSLQPDTR
ncbi:hypothetical protein CISG_02892 [Coccidioides immitis RMSCC 3703]|uniref:Uncharacterized protein n=1 Tax=Coccidioides immitis RMSCC 3703 TaxID=454286 RepID=A0A0J8RAK2_COCIT|nr:hypothetical protein CISG_02892 [Coccidioides immitis RMSCC 3703]